VVTDRLSLDDVPDGLRRLGVGRTTARCTPACRAPREGWRPYDGGMLRWDELLAYCLAKPGAWPDEPWGDGVVAKVGPKIFAFLGVAGPGGEGSGVGVKCGTGRETADEWLLRYPQDASPSHYIGRSGWNRLALGGAIPDDEILEAVDVSYELVVSKLPKKDRPPS
jgi:predicted DNA-binding protein (MmcQ/YjbR family)